MTAQLVSPRPSGWRRALSSLRRSVWALIALAILALLVALAVVGPAIAPQDPNAQHLILRLTPPLETDANGQVEQMLRHFTLFGISVSSQIAAHCEAARRYLDPIHVTGHHAGARIAQFCQQMPQRGALGWCGAAVGDQGDD